jgi:pimeloyl-ACP methyl ester carboxylesterase
MTERYESDIAAAFPRGNGSATASAPLPPAQQPAHAPTSPAGALRAGSRLVLVHGTATDGRVWTAGPHGARTAAVLGELQAHGVDIHTPTRPQSGDLDTEVAFLAPLCEGAYVVGVSGGATLGLELAARGVEMAGAVLHEPAAGSLVPGLLAHVLAGLDADGLPGFGHALYGPSWQTRMTRASVATVRAELAMFSAFEPAALTGSVDRVALTVGGRSPAIRHRSVAALSAFLDVPVGTVPGVGHAVHLDGGLGQLLGVLGQVGPDGLSARTGDAQVHPPDMS